ncbi:MAG TPA: hypothetical protein VIY51_08010 [Xanthobacteraceae bacterium]
MNETRPTSRARAPRSLRFRLLVGAGIVAAAGAAWAVLDHWGTPEEKSEVIAYRLCVASAGDKCPADAAFVRNQGEDTVARWAQRECAGYKRRRIIVSDGPADCNCTIANVTCSSD